MQVMERFYAKSKIYADMRNNPVIKKKFNTCH